MAMNGIDTLMAYSVMYNSGVSRPSQQAFDYSATQKQTQSMITAFKQNNQRVETLQKGSSDFLKQYTGGMNALNTAAGKLTNGNLQSTLQAEDGRLTDAAVNDVVSLTKDMVAEYNNSLNMLDENQDRGVGVQSQLGRMAEVPASQEEMEAVGIAQNEDGTLSLDEERLAAALRDEDTGRAQLAAEILGGQNGIAAGIQQDARAGLNTSSGSLVNNDVARVQSIRDNDPIRTFAQSLRGGGAYALNNSAAMGILMNMLA